MAEEEQASDESSKQETTEKEPEGTKADPKPDEKAEEKPEAKPDGEAKDGDSSTQQAPEDKKVPEQYELKLSEDSLFDPSYVDEFSKFAKERGLNNEEAQQYLNREEAAAKTYHDKILNGFEQTKEEWANQAKLDKEIGGENFEKNIETAKRYIDRFAADEFKDVIKPYQNHPELIRMIVRASKAGQEAEFVEGSKSPKVLSIAERMYGSKTIK